MASKRGDFAGPCEERKSIKDLGAGEMAPWFRDIQLLFMIADSFSLPTGDELQQGYIRLVSLWDPIAAYLPGLR